MGLFALGNGGFRHGKSSSEMRGFRLRYILSKSQKPPLDIRYGAQGLGCVVGQLAYPATLVRNAEGSALSPH
jgi:hypothetical protein